MAIGESSAGGEKSNSGLVTECRKIIDAGQTHHLPPGMLLVWAGRGRLSSRLLLCPLNNQSLNLRLVLSERTIMLDNALRAPVPWSSPLGI